MFRSIGYITCVIWPGNVISVTLPPTIKYYTEYRRPGEIVLTLLLFFLNDQIRGISLYASFTLCANMMVHNCDSLKTKFFLQLFLRCLEQEMAIDLCRHMDPNAIFYNLQQLHLTNMRMKSITRQ
ncbi:MAG: hypothetical protein EZS28_033049 [Streblomastix strix]|uniref:Uncharacterized protein n=1 Tax=Streblomastix strix TaxID=222440 RepID=A0A5J4UMH1_9EUKA|nr:MAG: hypothetical protein EZS28_033049 [Streblomastix strix]